MSDDGKWKPLSFEDEQYKMYPDQFHIFGNNGQSSENILPESLQTQSDFTSRVNYESDDGEWKPLSFEDEQYKMYPDQFHIFENYGQSSENILPESLLTQSDFTSRVNHRNIKGEKQNCVKNNKIATLLEEVSSSEESDEDYNKLKEIEQTEKEQIRSMRNIGLLPISESCLTSKKTSPSIINNTTKLKKGLPIILDEDFFKFHSTKKTEIIGENLEKVKNNTSSTSSVSNFSSITTDFSRISVGSNNSSFNQSFSSDEQIKAKPKTVHEYLKIEKQLPTLNTKERTFEGEFPCLNDSMKNKKNKKKTNSENLCSWRQ